MGAAEESSAHFDSVPNDPALAVLANRGHRLNRTLEAVEDVTSACGCQFETLVVFVATNFTGSHIKKLLSWLRKRTVNNHGGGKLFDRTEFVYDEKSDTFRCPAGQTLWRKQLSKKDRSVTYTPRRKVCDSCALKARCTLGPRRYVSRNLHEAALQRMQQRTTAEVMRLRGSTVEHPFATIKYRIFGHPRFLLRRTGGAQTEISLATIVYNLKRMLNVLGGSQLRDALAA
jgi:hypothetical protein